LPHNSLWGYAREYFYKFNIWMNGPIYDLDGERLPEDILQATKALYKLQKVAFKELADTNLITGDLRNLYTEFRPYLPIIVSLKNPDLKPRHCEIIQKLSDPIFDLDYDLHQSISDLVKLGVQELIEDIEEVSEIATKERALELNLNKMRDEWKTVKFELQEFSSSGTYLL